MNTRQHFLVPLFIWNFVMMFPKPNESWHFKFIISSNSSIFGCLNEDASAIAFQMRIYIIVCSNSVIDIVLCAAMNDTNYNVCIWSDLNVTGRFFSSLLFEKSQCRYVEGWWMIFEKLFHELVSLYFYVQVRIRIKRITGLRIKENGFHISSKCLLES